MKGLKLSLMVLMATMLALGLSGMAYAFHSGGVAECGGCHSMHSPAAGGTKLLIKTDGSSVCLSCHAPAGQTSGSSYHIMTLDADAPVGQPPVNYTPGGDFGWIRKTYAYSPRTGENVTETGQEHGHNVVASDYGMSSDPDKPTAPGGAFNSLNLGCQSCHDPHGQFRRDSNGVVQFRAGGPIIASGSYNNSPGNGDVTALPLNSGQTVGVYRLLAGNGYNRNGVTFTGAPQAVAPSSYNRAETVTQTRVAYGNKSDGGHVKWGTWCATCHGDMHSSGNYVHKVDTGLGGTIRGVYQTYKGSGDMTGADATSYLTLVPFAENGQTYAQLGPHANTSYLNGPQSDLDEVNCLSCHRAHASGFKNALRWNMEGEMILVDGTWPGTDVASAEGKKPKWAQGRTYAEMKAAYYGYPETKFASFQRVLCNKCHAKD